MQSEVAKKMEYIQRSFLASAEDAMRFQDMDELGRFLDQESPEFRSLVYEGASYGIGLRDLQKGSALTDWIKFYNGKGNIHPFHLDIGLGWSFAKAEISPRACEKYLDPLMMHMTFDGVGYYYALFKGRRTLKQYLIPENLHADDLPGFDQGIGRRLWYHNKGNVEETVAMLSQFQIERHPDLWRGVGVACGYAGGSTEENLNLLLQKSGAFSNQLRAGIALAALSRYLPDCITENIKLCCEIICEKSFDAIVQRQLALRKELYPDGKVTGIDFITKLIAEFK
jgi:enediyne biosynthesis protein E3